MNEHTNDFFQILHSSTASKEIHFEQRVQSLRNEIILDRLLKLKDNSSDFVANYIDDIDSVDSRGVFLLRTIETILDTDNFIEAIHTHFEQR